MLGVMQGRLLPKYQGRYQAHPVGYWQGEFKIAATLKLHLIEFILDYDQATLNPLFTNSGLNEIKQTIKQTGVQVKTICADYFMQAPLHSENLKIVAESRKVLQQLIPNAAQLGVTDIVIPCVDQSSLNSQAALIRFVAELKNFESLAKKHHLHLALETDLAPLEFKALLGHFDPEVVTVNYDIGNSAALGYDCVEELLAYGDRISDIHIKDRKLGGGSVILGQGNADFKKFFEALKSYNYRGPFIMQVYRDDEGVAIFKKQLAWVMPYLKNQIS